MGTSWGLIFNDPNSSFFLSHFACHSAPCVGIARPKSFSGPQLPFELTGSYLWAVCVYVHTCTLVYLHACVLMHQRGVYMYMWVCWSLHVCMCTICLRVYVHAHTVTYVGVYGIYGRAYVHVYTCICLYAHLHAHISSTPALFPSLLLGSVCWLRGLPSALLCSSHSSFSCRTHPESHLSFLPTLVCGVIRNGLRPRAWQVMGLSSKQWGSWSRHPQTF